MWVGKNYKSFEVELLILRIAFLKALLELEGARPNVSKEMFRFAEESLAAAFKLEKAKLVACDEEKVQYAEKSYYEAEGKIGDLFKQAGFALFCEEIEGEDVVVIRRWEEEPEKDVLESLTQEEFDALSDELAIYKMPEVNEDAKNN